MSLAVAVLTWNLVSGTLFIGLPSDGLVDLVCVDDHLCVVPDNRVVVVVPWDGPTPRVRARYTDQSWVFATEYPSFTG